MQQRLLAHIHSPNWSWQQQQNQQHKQVQIANPYWTRQQQQNQQHQQVQIPNPYWSRQQAGEQTTPMPCLWDRGSQWNCAAEHDCGRNW